MARGGLVTAEERGDRAATIADGLDRLDRWIEARDFVGHDPFDALLSPFAAPVRWARWPSVVLTQLRRRSRMDLSGILAIPTHENPKALALGVHADLTQGYPDAADGLLRRLLPLQHASGGWGYPFPWANRHFRAAAGTPSGVVTAFVCRALLHRLRFPGGDPPEMSEALGRAANFIRTGLGRRTTGEGQFLFTYTPGDQRGVHNASLLAAEVLATVPAALQGMKGAPASPTDSMGGGPEAEGDLEAVSGALKATLAAQRPDGLWPYGTSARDGYVDSYHTGYVLSSIRRIRQAAALDPALDRRMEEATELGLRAWMGTFLTGPGVAWRPGVPLPVELHGVAQAILTFLEFRDRLPQAHDKAQELAIWAIQNAQREDGAFYYLWHPTRPNRNAYMRWTQAWMLHALTTLNEDGEVA